MKINFLRKVRRFCDKYPQLTVIVKYWLYTAITTLTGIALYYILLLCFDFDHSTAYVIQYAVSVVMLFFVKFCRSKGASMRSLVPRMLGFFLLYGISMIMGERALVLYTEIWHIPAAISLYLTYPVTLAINTLGARFLIFRDTDNKDVAAAKARKQKSDKERRCDHGGEEITQSHNGTK